MKKYIKIVFAVCFTSVVAACSSSDDTPNTPSPYEQYGTPFEKMPAKEDAIIYQVNIRAFSNAGTLNGVTEKLDAIHDLGVNVIYLMPIYPVGVLHSVGTLGSPYSVRDYKAVSAEFGTLADLRKLVEEAHKKNMAVILDWVANHTSWDNAWITDHPDWYQKNDKGEIISPPGSGYADVAQLDFNNQEMRAAMVDAMSYWVYSANIDGFRCDYADFVPQNFWSQATTTLRPIKNQNILMLAEGSKVNHFAAGFDYTFGFGFFDALKKVFKEGKSATSIQDANAAEYATNYNNSQRIVRYTSNHDVNWTDGTPLQLFGGKQGSMATFVVAAYMKSVPMIYNAQEIGYAQKIDYFTHTPIDWSTADAGVLAEYKKIIAFRNSSNAIKRGTYKGYSNDAVSAFTMETDTEKVFVLSNLTNSAAKYIFPNTLSKIAWKNAFDNAPVTVTTEITLEPYQYIVLKN
ncbi:alpha-amylase family glycosyl hydrolase [Flavobacterium sp. 5]|uniref:alpha-amylase family glycosyl hydrolase n=1 Tax=Flavobacterium sp. 5 TaxID=2035199 RepID=UPI000C2C193E|nr:alpha-amylase family glycosyl hydrolase [Flavobacterium sp. 5]PKB16819.1 glycosidase [Flavobacterium sp. 5]